MRCPHCGGAVALVAAGAAVEAPVRTSAHDPRVEPDELPPELEHARRDSQTALRAAAEATGAAARAVEAATVAEVKLAQQRRRRSSSTFEAVGEEPKR